MSPLMQQIRIFIQQFSVAQRVALFTIAIGVLSALIALALWANRPEYALLYRDLSPEDANQMVTTLSDDGVPYQLSAGGTTIYVAAGQVSEYRLAFAAGGLATGSVTGYELFDEQRMGMTTFMQRVNFQRALEGELTQTINQMAEVRTSRVHLVIPEKKFFEEPGGASASIVLHLQPTAFMMPRQIQGIAVMVANSVPDLLVENVSIVDATGKLLTNFLRDEGDISLGSRNWEIRQNVEVGFQRKVQDLLDDVLGPGRSIVRVAADLNFETLERTRTFFGTEDAAVLSEEISVENFIGIDTSSRSTQQTVTNYELDKTVEYFVASSGDLNRLTVAVLVDGSYQIETNADGDEELVYQPRPQSELDQLAALVSSALGIDVSRGDQIEVQNLQFDRKDELAEMASINALERGDFWRNLLTNGAIGVALMITIFILLKVLRSTAETVSTALLAAPAATGVLVGGPSEIMAIPGAEGAIEARGKVEMVSDTFLAKLSPEARAQLEAQDLMTHDVTKFAEENPEGAAQLLRIWTSASRAE